MNHHLATAVVAPMTTKGRPYPSRVACRFGGKQGLVVLDRIRTVDTTRLVKRIGLLSPRRCRLSSAASRKCSHPRATFHLAQPAATCRASLRPAIGNRRKKVVPWPTSVSKDRVPPCLSTTIERAMAPPPPTAGTTPAAQAAIRRLRSARSSRCRRGVAPARGSRRCDPVRADIRRRGRSRPGG